MGTPAISGNGQMPDVMPAKEPAPGDASQPQPAEPRPEVLTVDKAEFERMREDNARAKGYVVALTKQLSDMMEQNRRPQEPDLPPRERQQMIKELLNEDPETALDAHFHQRIGPIVQKNRQTLAAINRDRAIEKIGAKEWAKWGQKIEEFMAPFDEETRADPEAYTNAYKFVRLNHVDDIVEERLREKMQEQQRHTLLEGSSSNAAASASAKPLTSIEKQMAKEFNMTEDEWRKFGASPTSPAEG